MYDTATVQPAPQTADFYRLIFETLPHMVWAANAEGVLEFCNAGCREYFGLDFEQLVASRWRVVHDEDRPECLQRWNESLRSGEMFDARYRLRRADGEYRWHRGCALPVRAADGAILHWFGTCTDIDDDVQAGRRSEARVRSLLALSSDWYWEQDAELRFTFISACNPEADRMNARRIGLRRWEIDFVNMSEADWAEHRATLEARRPFRHLVLCRLDASGNRIWTTTSGAPVFDAAGEFLGYRGVARDITRQRRAEEALRASELRFQAFMDHSPAIAWIKDGDLRYRYVSEPFLRQLRKTRADVIGKTVLEVWPEIPESAHMFELDGIVQREGRTLQAIDSGILRADGSVSHWLVSKFPLPDETGATHVAGVSLDITDRIEAEGEIRELLDRLVAAQEWERKRLAVELHDLIGQNLTALGISLANLARRVSDPQVGVMQRTVEQTIEAIRGVMTALRPPGLDEYGLVPALSAYAAEFQARTTLRTTFESRGAVRRLPAATEMSLFRIVQEALTNAAKHSGALSVSVRVEEVGGVLRLDVADNGRGIAEPETRRPGAGWGLRAMRERAQACGGTLRLESPGRGLRMVVEVPLGD